MKIVPLEAEWFVRTDRHEEAIGAIHSLANAPKIDTNVQSLYLSATD
jgi:hypothetical protein